MYGFINSSLSKHFGFLSKNVTVAPFSVRRLENEKLRWVWSFRRTQKTLSGIVANVTRSTNAKYVHVAKVLVSCVEDVRRSEVFVMRTLDVLMDLFIVSSKYCAYCGHASETVNELRSFISALDARPVPHLALQLAYTRSRQRVDGGILIPTRLGTYANSVRSAGYIT